MKIKIMMQVLNRLFKWNCFKHFINLKNLQGALAKKTKNEFAYNGYGFTSVLLLPNLKNKKKDKSKIALKPML